MQSWPNNNRSLDRCCPFLFRVDSPPNSRRKMLLRWRLACSGNSCEVTQCLVMSCNEFVIHLVLIDLLWFSIETMNIRFYSSNSVRLWAEADVVADMLDGHSQLFCVNIVRINIEMDINNMVRHDVVFCNGIVTNLGIRLAVCKVRYW